MSTTVGDGSKLDSGLKAVMRQNRGPDVLWRMLDDPELTCWMMHDGDGLAEGCGNFVVTAIKVDGVVVVDAAAATEREVEIEEGCGRTGAHATLAPEGLVLPDFEGFSAEGAVYGAALARDLHLENIVSLRPGFYAGMPLWRRAPLRLPSGRAVSCARQSILCPSLNAASAIRSYLKKSSFVPSSSSFVPAPTGFSLRLRRIGRYRVCAETIV